MSREQVGKIIEEAKCRFLKNERPLLATNVNERSLTHKFAEYLQQIVGPDWSVDCEYNRYGQNPKVIDAIKNIVGRKTSTEETKSKTVYPDIIIHKRGPDGPNLLVIEAKKDATEKEKKSDCRKLKIIKQKYKYSYAAFINFLTKTKELDIKVELKNGRN